MTEAHDHPASGIIDAFGGIRPMASKLGVPVSTVQGWKQRDSIPDSRMDAIREAARENGIALPDRDAASAEGPAIEHEDDSPPRSASAAAGAARSGTAAPLAVVALLVALAAAGWSWWTTQGPGAAGDGNARLAALGERIERLAAESAAAPADPGAEARAKLESDVAALRDQIANLATTNGAGGAVDEVRAALARLRDEVSALNAGAETGLVPESAARIAALETEVENAVQLAATNMQAMSGGILEFETRLTELAERVDALDARLEEIAAHLGRVGALEAATGRDVDVLADAVALGLTAAQLRRAIETGAPYRSALGALEAFAGDDAELAPLLASIDAAADGGVATRAALATAFADTAASVLAAVPDEADTLDRVLGRLQEVVRVRRVGASVAGDTPEAIVARAEFRLGAGDVAGAVETLSGLNGAAARAAEDWLARAREHLAVDAALARLEARALERLEAASAGR